MSEFDVVIVGGGLGGAAFAKSMAERGKKVVVVERETQFRDRVRGEAITPWGCAEMQALGIYDLLKDTCAHELPWWDVFIGPMQIVHRELPTTTPQGLPTLAFSHPEMQRVVLEAARAAGAEVRTGCRVVEIKAGDSPSATIEDSSGKREELSARMVVCADGRGSFARKAGGFAEKQDKQRLFLAGLVFENTSAPDDRSRLVNDFATGRGSIIFPQGKGRARVYLAYSVNDGVRLQGDRDIPAFVEACIATGMPREYFDGATPAGPLASFEGADSWVEHPYRDGIALIGDAAVSTDPSWGQGLSLTLRDARVLADALTATEDWNAAGNAYAAEHDRYYHVVHTVEDWLTQFFYEVGPEADARRGRAFPLIAEDPMRVPDTVTTGPDHPLDDSMRKRFFAEVE